MKNKNFDKLIDFLRRNKINIQEISLDQHLGTPCNQSLSFFEKKVFNGKSTMTIKIYNEDEDRRHDDD